tara:strand:- start:669 stop:1592 length:924 start_codon:yes stop_codon:yes gene_type:complete
MRNKFAELLYKYGSKNKNVYLVAADISPAGSIEKFRKKNPYRFINVGVAEQSMIGISAGLSMMGKIVFAYTIAAFSVFRPFEMIRDDLCYQNLPVVVVGMGAGTAYHNLGGTHLTQEDISVLKSLPNMQIISPADPLELKYVMEYCIKQNTGPLYLRLGKSGEKIFTHKAIDKWKFGKIRKIINGNKIAILTYGPIINLADKTISELKKYKLKPSLYNCHTLKPLDKNKIKSIFKKYKLVVVIEDHSEINGLASDIKNIAYENKYKGKIINFSLKDKFFHTYEKQEYMLNLHGISINKIKSKILSSL